MGEPSPERADERAVVDLVDRAVATRDQAAFGALYDRYLDRVYRYLYYRTGNGAEAEDLAELVFLKAWEAIHRFRWQGRPFLAWLYRLAHNALIDYRRAKRPTSSLDADDEHGLSLGMTLASEAATTELARRLDAEVLAGAVSQLTPDQQQVILLKFVDGWDNREIAEMLGKREGAIRALQLRALLHMRRVLEEPARGEGGVTERPARGGTT